MPITGKVHQPPPVHQVFEGWNFVVCNFLPRKVDYHELAIPVPYYHSNVDSDEVMFYVGGDYEARKGSGIGIGSISPAPGRPRARSAAAARSRPGWGSTTSTSRPSWSTPSPRSSSARAASPSRTRRTPGPGPGAAPSRGGQPATTAGPRSTATAEAAAGRGPLLRVIVSVASMTTADAAALRLPPVRCPRRPRGAQAVPGALPPRRGRPAARGLRGHRQRAALPRLRRRVPRRGPRGAARDGRRPRRGRRATTCSTGCRSRPPTPTTAPTSPPRSAARPSGRRRRRDRRRTPPGLPVGAADRDARDDRHARPRGARRAGPPGDREALRPRPRVASRSSTRRSRRSSRRSRSSASTTSSARRPCRTSWRCASPTGSSSRRGTAAASPRCRSTSPRTLAIEGRGSFYESTGALRDMVSTHLCQMLGFVALEDPGAWSGARPCATRKAAVFADAPPARPGARRASGSTTATATRRTSTTDSDVETFVALEACVDNDRWRDVPFLPAHRQGDGRDPAHRHAPLPRARLDGLRRRRPAAATSWSSSSPTRPQIHVDLLGKRAGTGDGARAGHDAPRPGRGAAGRRAAGGLRAAAPRRARRRPHAVRPRRRGASGCGRCASRCSTTGRRRCRTTRSRGDRPRRSTCPRAAGGSGAATPMASEGARGAAAPSRTTA